MLLVSGDGDFIPLIQEVMRHDIQVYISALSDGLNPKLEVVVDMFTLLDDSMFV